MYLLNPSRDTRITSGLGSIKGSRTFIVQVPHLSFTLKKGKNGAKFLLFFFNPAFNISVIKDYESMVLLHTINMTIAIYDG